MKKMNRDFDKVHLNPKRDPLEAEQTRAVYLKNLVDALEAATDPDYRSLLIRLISEIK